MKNLETEQTMKTENLKSQKGGTMRKLVFGLNLLVLILTFAGLAMAQPALVPYEGKLTDPLGVKLQTDTATIEFSIFAAASGGSPLWGPEKQSAVKLDNGVFNVLLGSIISFPPGLFDGSTRYLEIKVRETDVLSPRQPISTVPYARLAGTVPPGAIGSTEIADNTVTSTDITDGTITSADIADGSVGSADLTPNSVGSAEIANNSIRDFDIFDEPGIAAGAQGGGLLPNGARAIIASGSATFPSAGYALIISQATFRANAGAGGNWIDCFLNENGGGVESWFWDNGDVDGFYDLTQTKVSVRSVAAGAFTYDLLAGQFAGGGTTNYTFAKVIVLYFPTAYGTVTSPAPSLPQPNAETEVGAVPPQNLGTERTQSVPFDQARIERELAEMKAYILKLEEQLKQNQRVKDDN